MQPYFGEAFGNPASVTHAYGWEARDAVDAARASVAALIGADARELVFTSGATEANNLALLGVARAARGRGDHVVTCATEHPSVLDPCRALEKEGVRVSYLEVDGSGHLSLDALEREISDRTVLVSVMHANNEIGVIHPLADIARIARARGVLVHTDASQSVGKIPLDVDALGVDLLSCTAHKLYGPKGVGALWVRRRPPVPVEPLVYGGGHERGLRSGTLPTQNCVGFGVACELARAEGESEAARVAGLRDRLWAALEAGLEAVFRNGDPARCLPGNLNVSFTGIEGEALLAGLPELAVSSGSACTSARQEPSHVLRALGVGPLRALCAIRFGLGRFTTEGEIDRAAALVIEQVNRLRRASPVWDDR